MSKQPADFGTPTDIDADDLDMDAAIEPPATSDPAERVDGKTDLGGVGGPDPGGAG